MSRSLQFDIVANDKATGKINAVEGAVGNFGKKLGGMVTGFFALEKVASMVSAQIMKAFEWGSGLKDAATAIGLTAEEFQRLEHAARQSGVQVEVMQKAFGDMRKTIRDAGSGDAKAIAFISALGYSQEEAAAGAIDHQQAFIRLAEAISSAKTEQDKFNILSSIFGNETAQKLLPVMNDFVKLKKDMASAPFLTDEEAARLDRAADAMGRLSRFYDVLTARALLVAGNPLVMKALFGGSIFAQAGGIAVGAVLAEPKASGAPTVTEQGRTMADALAEAAKKANDKASAGASLASGLPTMAAIGGAAGFRGGAGGVERTQAILERIEENTRQPLPVPANGSTNFTNTADKPQMGSTNITTVPSSAGGSSFLNSAGRFAAKVLAR
jgi:hypothetical protein